MNVIDLASRRREKATQADCCDRHRLMAVVWRINLRLAEDQATVVPRSYLEAAAEDLRRVIDQILPAGEQETR